MKVEIIPYIPIDGIMTFRDSEIRDLFMQMQSRGLAETVFTAGDIRTANDFLSAMKYGGNILYVIYADDEQVGVVWLNRFEARFARVHWCLWIPPGKKLLQVGKETLRLLMYAKNKEGEYLYDMLMGITPSYNRGAVRLAEMWGMTLGGEIPNAALKDGISVPGIISYCTREEMGHENI